MTHEDARGVFVPFWMLAECETPAEAVYLAQLSWWYQPSFRGDDRARKVERKGQAWLLLRDAEVAALLGVSAPTVQRARKRLTAQGYVEALTAQVDGVRSALVRPVFAALQSHAQSDGDPESHAQNDGESRADCAGGHAQIARSHLSIEKKTSKREGDTPDDPVRKAADSVVTAWWEWRKAQGETPVQPYIAVVKIVERALRQGVTVHDMKLALAATPTVTAAALEYALSKLRGRVGRQAPDVPADVAAQIVADYEQANGRPSARGRGSALPSRT